MTAPQKHDTPRASDRLCCVCQRPAVGYGVAYKYEKQIHWCCGEASCFDIAARSFKMHPKDFAKLDTEAAEIGGQEGGAYLETLGKFSLDTLTPEEYAEYVRVVIGAYRNALHVTLRDASPF